MKDHLVPAHDSLIAHLKETARGPSRNGAFAVWLFVHVCEDELPPLQISSRARRRRLSDLDRRLSSLSMPPSLKRALSDALVSLAEQTPDACLRALKSVSTQAREHLGAELGDALSLAARSAKSAIGQNGQTAQ
jgi:hypothetical protein